MDETGKSTELKGRGLTHGLAFLQALLVLVMICFGASVTTMRAGDSDPDWSLFGIISWFRPANAGLAVELNHRKFGLLVGLVGLILVFRIWRRDPRAWVRAPGQDADTVAAVARRAFPA